MLLHFVLKNYDISEKSLNDFSFWAVILDLEDLFNKRTEMEDVPEVNLTTVPFYVR